MEENLTQDPPYRKKIYDFLKSNYEDFGRSEDEFYSKLDSDTAYAGKVHELISNDFSDFKRDRNEFVSSLSSPEKKSPSGPSSTGPIQSLGGSSASGVPSPLASAATPPETFLQADIMQPPKVSLERPERLPANPLAEYERIASKRNQLQKEKVSSLEGPFMRALVGFGGGAAAENDRQKRIAEGKKAVAATDKEFGAAKKSAMSAVENIVKDRIGENIKDFTTQDFTGVPVPDADKVKEWAQGVVRESGLPDDGWAWKALASKATDHVAFKIVQPRVDKAFEKMWKEDTGRDVPKNIGEYLGMTQKKVEIEKSLESDLNREKLEVEAQVNEQLTAVTGGVPIEEYAQARDAAYEQKIGSIQSKYAQLITPQGEFAGTPEQYAQYKMEFEAAQKDYNSELSKTANEIAQIQVNANRRFNRVQTERIEQAERMMNEFVSEKEELVPSLKKQIENTYQKAYKSVSDENDRLKEDVLRENKLLTLGASAASAIGGSINRWGSLFGSPEMQATGKAMENFFYAGNPNMENLNDWLNLFKAARSTGNLMGSMTTSMVPAVAAGIATGGMGGVALGTIISWAGESVDIAGGIAEQIYDRTGDPAKVQEGVSQAFSAQKLLLPAYFVEMSNIYGKIFTGGGLGRRIALGAGTEYLTETFLQEAPQQFFEESIVAGKGLEGFLDNFRPDNFESTAGKLKDVAVNTPSVMLMGGLGQARAYVDEQGKQEERAEAIRKRLSSINSRMRAGDFTGTDFQQSALRLTIDFGVEEASKAATSAYFNGGITYETFTRIQQSLSDAKEITEKVNAMEGITDENRLLFSMMNMEHRALERKAEKEQDPIFKARAKKEANERKAMLDEIFEGGTPNYATAEFEDGSFTVMTPTGIKKAMSNPAFMQEVVDGKIKFNAFGGDSRTVTEELAKSISDFKQSQRAKVDADIANRKKEQAQQEEYEAEREEYLAEMERRGTPVEEATAEVASKEASKDESSISVSPTEAVTFTYESEKEVPVALKNVEPTSRSVIEAGGKTKVRLTYTGKQLIDAGVASDSTVEEVAAEAPQAELTDSEYSDFIDNGIVSEERLMSIAEKVKAREQLGPRKMEMFSDKTSEINKMIAASQSNKQTPTEPTTQPSKEPVSESELNRPKTIKELESENKTTAPKVRSEKVFLNKVTPLNREGTKGVDKVIKEGAESSLPIESVSVEKIIPTQKNLTIQNLEETKDVVDSSDEVLLVERDGMFYVIDGHHRIANRILEGNASIDARVYREEDAQGKETPREAQAQEKVGDAQTVTPPKKKLNLSELATNLESERQWDSVEGELLNMASLYNRIGKKKRKDVIGTKLMADMQNAARKSGYLIRPGITGRMTILDPNGKEVVRKKGYISPEKKAEKAKERKEDKQYRRDVLSLNPISVEHFFAMTLADGKNKLNTDEVKDLLGEDYDIPSWMIAENGMSIAPNRIAPMMRGEGFGMDQEVEVSATDVEKAIVLFADTRGREKAFDVAEEIYLKLQRNNDPYAGMTEEDAIEMYEALERQKALLEGMYDVYGNLAAIDELTEDQAQALEDEILSQEKYEASTQFIKDAERYATGQQSEITESEVGQTETPTDADRDAGGRVEVERPKEGLTPKYKEGSTVADRFKDGLLATTVFEGGELDFDNPRHVAVWRSMGPKEFMSILDGKKYGGSGPKKGAWFASFPKLSASITGKDKFLVEYGGVVSDNEASPRPLGREDITGVWRYDGKKWQKMSPSDIDSHYESQKQPTKSSAEIAKSIRDKKITGTLFVDPLFGGIALTKAVYNGALELAAKLVEQNTAAGAVIEAVVKYIEDAMKGKSFKRTALETDVKRRLWFIDPNAQQLYEGLKDLAREYGESVGNRKPTVNGLHDYIRNSADPNWSRRDYTQDAFNAVFNAVPKPEAKEPAKGTSKKEAPKKESSAKAAEARAQEREKIEDLRKEIEEYTSPEGRAATDSKLNDISGSASEQADNELSGIMNALVPEDKQGLYEKSKRTVAETLENGRRMIDSGAIDPWLFMQSILKNPRPLTPDETAAMVYYKAKLDGRVSNLTEQIDKAIENGDTEAVSLAELALTEVEAYIEDYYKFQEASGYEQGLSLRMRQLLLTKEYELANQVRKYKKETGKRFVPAEVMAKFKVFDEAIRELGKRIDEFERRSEKASNDLEILSDPPTDKPRTKSEAAQQLAKKVRQAKFVRSAKQLSSLQSDPAGLFKFAWDGAMEFIATTIEQGGTLADAIDSAIDHLKKSDWYKSLSDKGKEKFNETAKQSMSQEAYEYAGVKVPEMNEDGGLSIPSSFIKDLIRNGFDTIETATTEAQRILSEYFGIEASERQVRDAISDYGKMSRLSKDEIDQKMREMKRVGKLVSALEDVQKKKRPLRSGKERDALTQKEREIRREINALLKDIPQTSEETETAWKTALDATKKRLKNRIEDLETQIREGKKTPAKKSVELDAEAKYLKEEVKRLNEVLRSIEGKPEMTFEQRVRITEQAISKSIEEYERRIREKDFEPLSKDPVSTPEIEDLRRRREELRKQYKQAYDQSPQKQAGIDSAAMKRLQKQINEITDKIHGRISIESRRESSREYSAHVKAMQERVKSLRDILKETDSYKEMAEKRALENVKKSARKSIEEYERRIREKDFATRKPKQVQLNDEAKALKAEQQKWKNKFDTEREKNRLDERTASQKVREGLVDIVGVPKSLVASLDFSSVLRQGGMLSARHPRMAVKATKEMLKQTFSEEKYEKWMDEFIVSDIYNEAKKAGLYIASPNAKLLAKEESFVSNIAEMIPIYGRLVKASNRAYSSYLNTMRIAVFSDFRNQIMKSGLSEKDAELAMRDMAVFINNATGRGSIFEYEPNSPELNLLFFSPRFVLSRANIVMNTATGYAAYHPKVRKEALLTVASYLGATMTLVMLSMMAGADGEEDPRSSDFGKIRIGNLRLDPFAGFSQMVTFLSRMISGQSKSLRSGKIKDLGEGGFGRTRLDVIGSFIRSKMAPIPSAFVDFADAPKEGTKKWGIPKIAEFENRVYFKNIVGEEQTIPERVMSLTTPIYTQDVLTIYSEEGLPMTALATVSDIVGIGSQYHSKSEEATEDALKEYKKEEAEERDAAVTGILDDLKQRKGVRYIDKSSIGKEDSSLEKIGSSKAKIAERFNADVFKEMVGKEDGKLGKAFITNNGEGNTFVDAKRLAENYYTSISKEGVSAEHLRTIRQALKHLNEKGRNTYIETLKKEYRKTHEIVESKSK
jgi:hypothetical protein